jgi:hypothetical protein
MLAGNFYPIDTFWPRAKIGSHAFKVLKSRPLLSVGTALASFVYQTASHAVCRIGGD